MLGGLGSLSGHLVVARRESECLGGSAALPTSRRSGRRRGRDPPWRRAARSAPDLWESWRSCAGEERAELYTALLVLATIDPWGHTLQKELMTMVEDMEERLLRRTPIIAEMILEAEQKAEREGQMQGREEASAWKRLH